MVFRRSLFPVAKPPATVANDVREQRIASAVESDPNCALTLDLLPVPTAVMTLTDGAITFESVNQAFKQAGFGTDGRRSPLIGAIGDQIAGFLRSTDVRQRLALRLGDAIDCRQYDVTLARRAVSRTIARCLVTLVDQTPEQRTETSLRREMNTDSLTGLPNRAGFDDRIDERITDANRVCYAVLAINLDRFSRINACMGSLSGDELLISVARRLRGALRARDTLARTGGDEFAVLMTVDDGSEDALQVAGRIQQALVQPFRLSDFQIQVDCSIGIALGQDAADDTENLIRHAQFAVKRSKRTGQTEVYRPDLFDIVRNQFSIETELRMAIEQGELTFAFQPICDLSTGRVSSFEALARWRTRDGRAISPMEFIPVAEESGLIVPLGRLAMDQAAQTLASWDAAAGGHCGVNLAVNLSAVQLQRDDVATMVGDVLSRHGLCGKRFDIELTESAFVVDPDRTLRTMLTLKELGASIAMDDFGTGYSNLAYLQKLPIDKLKIDRSFVTGMMADRDKVAIVGAILSLSQALGMRTVAEGIETPELEQALAAMGCAFGQGFFYSQPIDADAAYRFLTARNH